MSRLRHLAALAVLIAAAQSAQAVEDVLPPSIEHEPCDQYQKGQPFVIWARFKDDSQLFDPKVIYRSGSNTWKNVAFERVDGTGDFRATLQSKDLKGSLDYFIEVFDENGNGPARFGSTDAPVHITAAAKVEPCRQITDVAPAPRSSAAPRPVAASTTARATAPAAVPALGVSRVDAAPGPTSPPPGAAPGPCERTERPLYCSPALWASLGAVALAGSGVGAYFFAFRGDRAPAGPATRVRVVVTGPDPTAASLSRETMR